MEKPYFLLSTTSGKSQYVFDRRIQKDKETAAMRERLLSIGCTQKELTEEEKNEILKGEDWITF